jgi:hypothetical protein
MDNPLNTIAPFQENPAGKAGIRAIAFRDQVSGIRFQGSGFRDQV